MAAWLAAPRCPALAWEPWRPGGQAGGPINDDATTTLAQDCVQPPALTRSLHGRRTRSRSRLVSSRTLGQPTLPLIRPHPTERPRSNPCAALTVSTEAEGLCSAPRHAVPCHVVSLHACSRSRASSRCSARVDREVPCDVWVSTFSRGITSAAQFTPGTLHSLDDPLPMAPCFLFPRPGHKSLLLPLMSHLHVPSIPSAASRGFPVT